MYGLTLLAAAAGGCGASGRTTLLATTLDGPVPNGPLEGSPAAQVSLSGAGGEWLDFVASHRGQAAAVRLRPLHRIGDASGEDSRAVAAETRIYRIAQVPADTNHAGYLRLYGGAGQEQSLGRALVPLPEADGAFRLPQSGAEETTKLWIDLQLPRGLPRGMWRTAVEAFSSDGKVLARLPVEVRAHGFDLPAERTLIVSAPLEWERLAELWPDEFADASPSLLSRDDGRTAAAVEVLDSLITQAQADRVQVTVPALSGVMKWPAGRAPEGWWGDFDSVMAPWLSGTAFKDGVALRDWPVPRLPDEERHAEAARAEYWQAALAHLDEAGLLNRFVVLVNETHIRADPRGSRRNPELSPFERMRLSQEAGRIALAYPEGEIALPLESDQVRFTGPQNPDMFPPEHARRLMIRADGLVTDQATRPWPAGLEQPRRYLELEGPTPAPVPGPGASESDIRLWGWLAFLRGATHLQLEGALPPSAGSPEASDPTQIVWFYPGEAFGVDEHVPSVQLKWLRRAQQDYEYLHAASIRLEEAYARVIARALVRPVRVEEGQVDPVLPLIAGTPEASLWREGLELVAGKVAIADPQASRSLPPRFAADHTNRTTSWLAPRERPVPIVSRTYWELTGTGPSQRVVLQLTASIYNPSDARPEGMTLAFGEMPGGEPPGEGTWENPGETRIPPIATYEVAQAAIATSAPVDALGFVFPTYQQGPMRLAVRNEYTGAVGSASAVVPAVVVDERNTAPTVDGLLGEWMGNEAIIDGRMVLMHNRPALQAGLVRRTEKPAQAFAAWTADGLHIAFRFEGATAAPGGLRSTRNFVDTEYRRVWGEDVCELLIQPVWTPQADSANGPLLHVVCKPNGAFARRRTDRRASAEPWQNFESGMRYAATVDAAGIWRAEVTLPWSALRDAGINPPGAAGPLVQPPLLRFNLSHHDGESGVSASWAGPVDFGADEHFTGAMILRRP